MNGNAELLNFIYQNSQMGLDTTKQLIDIVKDEEFKEHLNDQINKYEQINREAKEILKLNGYDEKGINSFDKIKTYIIINIQTLMDKTSSHIAEMIIIGSNMGIIDSIKNIKKYKDAEENILCLMKRLQELEEYNIKKVKMFL